MTQRHPIQHNAHTLVTIVTNKRIALFSEPSYAREFIETMYRVQALHPFFLYGFVVMPDHCHLLIFVPAPQKLSVIIGMLKSGFMFNTGLWKIWQKRFHVRIVRNTQRTLWYIHHNPVKAGIVQSSKDYPWSSANDTWNVTPHYKS